MAPTGVDDPVADDPGAPPLGVGEFGLDGVPDGVGASAKSLSTSGLDHTTDFNPPCAYHSRTIAGDSYASASARYPSLHAIRIMSKTPSPCFQGSGSRSEPGKPRDPSLPPTESSCLFPTTTHECSDRLVDRPGALNKTKPGSERTKTSSEVPPAESVPPYMKLQTVSRPSSPSSLCHLHLIRPIRTLHARDAKILPRRRPRPRRRLRLRPRAAAAAVGGGLPDVGGRRRHGERRGDAAPDVEGIARGGAEGGLGVEDGSGVGGERGEGGGGVGPGGEEGEGEGCVYYWGGVVSLGGLVPV